ncbi:MAG: DsbA family protein [Desulfobulbaceae bacterium]|jgi:predicted DsbA family dithiol-disulfide isomerase|nr:DsbA family protein [Desulfobulbaceae bacterium]
MRYCSLLSFGVLTLLCGPLNVFAADSPNDKSGFDGSVEWQSAQEWKTEGQPLDVAHSLDGRLVYILNNQRQVLVYSGDGKALGKIAVDDGVNAIDIAPQGESLFLINKKTSTFSALTINFVANDIDISGAPVKGPADAPVTIIVFTDFQCPYCIRLEPTLNEIFAKNKDKVKMVFKNFPLQMHPMADPAHRAAWAAGKQGKFWEFHDRLFTSPKLSPEIFAATAKDLGLNIEQFKADMESPQAKERMAKDIADGENAQVTGTPTVFINGRKPRERGPEALQRIIDEEIGKQSGK